MSQPTILVVEDEPHLARAIADNLMAERYAVEVAGDGELAVERFAAGHFDLVLLDVMLPKLHGYAVCQAIRQRDAAVPVLFLTARNASDERVMGLDAGGDDYLGKPFDLVELLARVRALLRRRRPPVVLHRLADSQVDFANAQQITIEGRHEPLSQREVRLLRCLYDHAEQWVSRETLIEAAWGDEVYPSSRELDALIEQLRQRFEPEPQAPRLFETQRGGGYRLRPTAAVAS